MKVNGSYSDFIEDITKLPHYRDFTCRKCGHKQEVFILLIQANCEKCGTRSKLRGYASIGSEVEDIIDTVISWLGKGREFEDAMKWKRVIDSYDEND